MLYIPNIINLLKHNINRLVLEVVENEEHTKKYSIAGVNESK